MCTIYQAQLLWCNSCAVRTNFVCCHFHHVNTSLYTTTANDHILATERNYCAGSATHNLFQLTFSLSLSLRALIFTLWLRLTVLDVFFPTHPFASVSVFINTNIKWWFSCYQLYCCVSLVNFSCLITKKENLNHCWRWQTEQKHTERRPEEVKEKNEVNWTKEMFF